MPEHLKPILDRPIATIALRVTPAQVERLDRLAAATGRTRSTVTRELIERGLDQGVAATV